MAAFMVAYGAYLRADRGGAAGLRLDLGGGRAGGPPRWAPSPPPPPGAPSPASIVWPASSGSRWRLRSLLYGGGTGSGCRSAPGWRRPRLTRRARPGARAQATEEGRGRGRGGSPRRRRRLGAEGHPVPLGDAAGVCGRRQAVYVGRVASPPKRMPERASRCQAVRIGALLLQQRALDLEAVVITTQTPSLRTTRWQGISTGTGLFASAVPTARTARGRPISRAIQA